jgi:predicted NBD/HSP70 family sugar kinase
MTDRNAETDRTRGPRRTGREQVQPVDLARGTNQSGVRLYNERLVLSLIRRHGGLSKAEIARQTGLTAQTITVIMRQLEADGLVVALGPQRGKVGQPSVPFALKAEGAFSLGLKVGRRSCDLILMDFAGAIVAALHETYLFPNPDFIVDFAREGCAELGNRLPPRRRRRISGLGVATPFELWNWEDEVGAPHEAMQAWGLIDLKSEIEKISQWPVLLCNDATAACAAELVFGNPGRYRDYLYVFVGWFIGGGIVLNGSLLPGRRGYAGAIAPMPIPGAGKTEPEQLLRRGSTYLLERTIRQAGGDPDAVWESPDDWSAIEPYVGPWIATIAGGIAWAAVSAASVIDFEAVIIDGAFPPSVRARLVERVKREMNRFDRQGLVPLAIVEGAVGSRARAIGGACLPLLANFAPDREVLFKETF